MQDHFIGTFAPPVVGGMILDRQCPSGTSFSTRQATLHASQPMHLLCVDDQRVLVAHSRLGRCAHDFATSTKVSRMTSEPVTGSVMTGRRALNPIPLPFTRESPGDIRPQP